MATIPVIPEVMQDIVDSTVEREFWVVVKEHERPPYFFDHEGVGNRLNRAARVVLDGRLTPNSDGSYTVEGSEGRTYRVAESCSCPQSQQGKSKWCYHAVAVALYIEWRRRLGQLLQQEALPVPPVTSAARLSAPAVAVQEARGEEIPPMTDAYIPEPDAAAPGTPTAATGVATLTTPATSSLDAQALTQSMQAWREQRQVVTRFLQQELREGTDFYTLRIKGRETKPALSKAGSEKFMALFRLTATFTQDTATWQMLGQPQGTLCYTCHLHTRSGELVGEGRGARTLQQDGGDINKAVKMAQKSAMVDAILRTGALSDVFTQDLEDPSPEPSTPARPSSADLRSRIWALVKQADATITTREACEAYVQRVTGLALEPDHYAQIVDAFEARR